MSEEKRIYVVVAKTVQAATIEDLYEFNVVQQPAGRIAAQVGHVVSKMRVIRRAVFHENYTPITTIVLAARNSAEMTHLSLVLAHFDVKREVFFDQNPDYIQPYVNLKGVEDVTVMTALCTHPIEPSKVTGLLDHLPLWKAKGE